MWSTKRSVSAVWAFGEAVACHFNAAARADFTAAEVPAVGLLVVLLLCQRLALTTALTFGDAVASHFVAADLASAAATVACDAPADAMVLASFLRAAVAV